MARIDVSLKIAASDFRWVSDPWGLGWEFEIARSDYPKFKAWGEEQRKKNPYFKQISKVGQATMVLQPDSKVSERIISGILEKIDPEQLEKLTELGKQGMAQIRIRSCRGVMGKTDDNPVERELEYTVALGLELLSDSTPVPEWIDPDDYFNADGTPKIDEDGHQKVMPEPQWLPLGDALFRFLAKQSEKLEQYRTDLREAAAKNSEESSASI